MCHRARIPAEWLDSTAGMGEGKVGLVGAPACAPISSPHTPSDTWGQLVCKVQAATHLGQESTVAGGSHSLGRKEVGSGMSEFMMHSEIRLPHKTFVTQV